MLFDVRFFKGCRFALQFSLFLFFFVSPLFGQYALLYQKDGAAAGDQLGFSVAGGGDVNGDGKADFIIGAYDADPGGLTSAGSAYVYSGADGSLLYQKDGGAAFDNFGRAVAFAGDVNGDGNADFIVGVPNRDIFYVYSGATGIVLHVRIGASGDGLGLSVAPAGDVNGDGKADFIVGAPYARPGGLAYAGSAYVYSGTDGSLLYQKNGAVNDQLGNSVASAGDVNGDGKADFIIGAYLADPGGLTNAGSAYVYSGATGTLFYQKNGAAAGDQLGKSVASAGDVNGDGKADFIIGTHAADPGGLVDAGSAYVYSGADGALLYQKDGASAGDLLGWSVASAGDVNRDGRADFILGAKSADPGGLAYAGSAYVYSGLDGSLLFQKNGAAAYDFLGGSVASAVNLKGDGRGGFIIGAEAADPGGLANAGSAFVFYNGYNERILNVRDIPNDQGKQVRIHWRSLPGNDNSVTHFTIFRRIDPPAGAKSSGGLSGAGFPSGSWEEAGVFMAFGDTIYRGIVPTLYDSTAAGLNYSVFFVRASGDNPLIYFDSPIDSGWSVDNLVPSAPAVLLAAATCQGTVNLSYSRPKDPDVQYFKIYRAVSPTFENPESIGNTPDSFFVDGSLPAQTLYYRVSAVDASGNEGPPSPQAAALPGWKGDLNADASLTPADAAALLAAIFLGQTFPAPFCAADANCDGALTPADVALELKAVFLGTLIDCTR